MLEACLFYILKLFCHEEIVSFIRYLVRVRNKLYYQITNDDEFYTFGKKIQKVISDGLKRSMCLSRVLLINEPGDVLDDCRSYDLR